MSKDRITMEEMDLGPRELPAAPVARPIRIADPEPQTEESRELIGGAYVPPAAVRDPTVTWSCRLPERLHVLLKDLAYEHHTDMSKIVVDLLEIYLPKIPRKRKR